MKVIGCGNLDRGDDGAGLLVARRLRAMGIPALEANGLTLLDLWEPDDDVILVDAVSGGNGDDGAFGSTHGLGVAEAIELARSLGRLPARLRVYGIEGQRFGMGDEMSPEVAQAVEETALQIAAEAGIERLRICLHGVVQGVGFRPCVYRLATEMGLRGWVLNSNAGLIVEVEGPRELVRSFEERMEREKPAPAVVLARESSRLAPAGYSRFEIRPSSEAEAKTAAVLPDLAMCDACRREVLDPANRRYHYPFTNCTLCGPRYTIVEDIPYDRPNTTMKDFRLCPECRREYEDPGDRRFHAQSNACPLCGPKLQGASVAEGAAALRAGLIVALKGIGGFQLLTDARNAEAIARLRRRKHREEKPFALMMPSIAMVERYCEVSDGERKLLESPAAPIVLMKPKPGTDLAWNVAHHSPYLGVMLPYSPLHYLLLAECGFPIVATSGNRSDEPIAISNEEAWERLSGIADVLVWHDRPIARPCDDSVVRWSRGRECILRRARGYAPLPVRVRRELPAVLAVGGHLKNTVAIAAGREVFLSQHVGDLDTPEALSAFERAIEDLCRLYRFRPELVACDLHPDYASTRWALASGLPVVRIQHHEAHVAACAAENDVQGPYLGVAWDGTGYGRDGTVWGGEFFLGPKMERIAHLRPFRLPGGEAAVREGWRCAASLRWEIFGGEGVIGRMIELGVNSPWTTSVGRLFDAVAAMSGVAQENRFEGQAAMMLERAIGLSASEEAYPLPGGDWEELVRRAPAGGPVAALFHNALVEWIVEVARSSGVRQVVLSGGCFQNRYLTERAAGKLEALGFTVYTHQRVPANDGGIALGQAVLAGGG